MSQPLLEVRDLRVSYHTYAGEVQAVRGLSFSMERGETLAVVGESGCGKSVSAKALMGLINCPPGELKPGSQVLFEGKNVLDFTPAEWSAFRGRECAMIFQDALAALNPTVTVGRQIAENLTVHHMAGRAEAMARAVEMLSLVGISQPQERARQYPHEFSGGMRQRAMIAMALACGPKLLIADEPTTAMDVTIQAQIIKLMKEMQQKFNMSVLLITHDLGVVADIAQNIAVVYAGRIVEYGARDDIFYDQRHPYTWSLLRSIPRLDLDGKIRALSGALERRFSRPGDAGFAQGFMAATLLFCVGTMAIKGSLDSGLIGDHSTLFAKAVMDTVLALVFASSMGAGVLFSAVPVFLYQGAIALLAAAAQPFLGDAVIAEMNSVGSLLLFALALDMLGVLHLRLANFIPAMFFPILYCRFL